HRGSADTGRRHGEHSIVLPRRPDGHGNLVSLRDPVRGAVHPDHGRCRDAVLRFMIQDLIRNAVPAVRETSSWTNNLNRSALSVVLWGYFLYVGVIDPLGGIWTLWPLFGTANQMLAAIALTLCTVVLFKMKRERFALVTIAPATWLVVCTTVAGLEKVFSPDP